MIGSLILGGLATFALLKLWRHRRYGCGYHRFGHHGHHGHHGHWGRHHGGWQGFGDGPFDDGPPRGWGRGMPVYLRYLSHRLDATPGQERALAEAVEKFRAEVAPLRAEVDKTRSDLAAAMRQPSFDEVRMGELFARHDEALEKARRALVGLGSQVHEALDERQRELLAGMIERGPRFGFSAW